MWVRRQYFHKVKAPWTFVYCYNRRLAQEQEKSTSLTQAAPWQQQEPCDSKTPDQETAWDACWPDSRSSGHLSGSASMTWLALKRQTVHWRSMLDMHECERADVAKLQVFCTVSLQSNYLKGFGIKHSAMEHGEQNKQRSVLVVVATELWTVIFYASFTTNGSTYYFRRNYATMSLKINQQFEAKQNNARCSNSCLPKHCVCFQEYCGINWC